MVDLTRRRSPSGWRRLINARARRLSARKSPDERREALASIMAIAGHALNQHDAEHDK